MQNSQRKFLPAAGLDIFLPLYDPFVKLLGADKSRRSLIEQARLHAGQRVLDIGCGTGTMLILIHQLHPQVELCGIDPDAKALAKAEQKMERAGVSAQLVRSFSDNIPFPDASFDRIFSSFMFHHIPANEKLPALKEIRRLLKPEGALHLVDFSGHSLLMRLSHSKDMLQNSSSEGLLALMKSADLKEASCLRNEKGLLFPRMYLRALAG